MNILLLKHPTTHFARTAPPVSGLPLGLLYVAAALRKAGHNVQIYDCIVDADESRWGYNESGDLVRMGATWEEIKGVVKERRPDVVGISNQYTSQVVNAIRTAETIKEVSGNIKVVVGGPHATVKPSTFFDRDKAVDFAVMGEGEVTMVELLSCLSDGRNLGTVNGIAHIEDGRLVINQKREFIEKLDEMPLPAYDLLDMERYFYFNEKGKDGRESYKYPGAERAISMITSRGCPFNCVFCSIHLAMGRKFRAHSVHSVLEHIRHVKERYGVNHIHFEDDNVSFDMSRFKNILDGMITNNFGVTWDTPNGVRADFLDEEVLRKCKLSGCTYLRVGVESANEHVSRRIVRKRLDIKKVSEVARLCNKMNIDLEAFYIIGFPGEKIDQMKETIDFAVRQERRYGLYPYDMFTATPLLGTDLYKICLENAYVSKEMTPENIATATQGEGMIATEDFAPEDLKKLIRSFRARHRTARVIFSLKFLIRYPQYLVFRLSNRAFVRHLFASLLRAKLLTVIEELFLYRYKKSVLRRVALK